MEFNCIGLYEHVYCHYQLSHIIVKPVLTHASNHRANSTIAVSAPVLFATESVKSFYS